MAAGTPQSQPQILIRIYVTCASSITGPSSKALFSVPTPLLRSRYLVDVGESRQTKEAKRVPRFRWRRSVTEWTEPVLAVGRRSPPSSDTIPQLFSCRY